MKSFTNVLIVALPAFVAIAAVWQSLVADYEAARELKILGGKGPNWFPFMCNVQGFNRGVLRRVRWEIFGWALVLVASIVGYLATFVPIKHPRINFLVGIVTLVIVVFIKGYFRCVKRQPLVKEFGNRCTCSFTETISDERSPRYRNRGILLTSILGLLIWYLLESTDHDV